MKGKKPFEPKDEKEAVRFIKKYHTGIVEKWKQFFVENKKVKCEVINKL